MVELVIKIPKEMYEIVQNSTKYIDEVARVCEDAVKVGTQLPKGHGRLIDADELMEYCQNDKAKAIDCNDIARFPTIIPADKEKEE